MHTCFDLDAFSLESGIVHERDARHAVLGAPAKETCRLSLAGLPGLVGGVDWAAASHLSVDVTSHMDWSIVFMFEFWEAGSEADEPDLTVRMSTVPGVRTRLLLPLSALDAQHIFLARTPGQLRSFVHGRRVDPGRLSRFAINVREGPGDQRFEVSDLVLTEQNLPADFWPMPATPIVDELGQFAGRNWPGKTVGSEAMCRSLQNMLAEADLAQWPEGFSPYGGWMGRRLEARGQFSLQRDDRRWWLVDPDGYVFFTTGMDCMRPGENGPVDSISPFFSWIPPKEGAYAECWEAPWWGTTQLDRLQFSFGRANLIRAFGSKWLDSWVKMARANLVRWGFNTIGAFSDDRFIRRSGLPYLLPLERFPTTERKIYRDFPDVFSDEYRQNSAVYAAQMAPHREDRLLIGYFLRNEPEWAFSEDVELAEELLAGEEGTATREALIRSLKGQYEGNLFALNRAWNTDFGTFDELRNPIRHAASLSEAAAADLNRFSAAMIREYVKVPSLAVREVDPVHLNLGMRYAFILYENQLAGKEYLDVFSINCYKIDPSEVLRRTIALAQMPVMIGEFHFGALDRGLQATGIIGVASQEDRGKAYRCYVEHAAAFPECVGIQYFQYEDQMVTGRPDGENYQIGFVDVCGRPYPEMVAEATDVNLGIYEVAEGVREPSDVQPVKIVANIAS